MDSMMPASVALNMPSTAAEVTVGSPHWPARGQGRADQDWGHPRTPHPVLTGATLGPPGCSPAPAMLHHQQGKGVSGGPERRGAAGHSQG